MKQTLKENWKTSVIAVIAVLVGYSFLGNGKVATYNFSTAKVGDITEIVLVSGNVTPVDSVELGFEVGGKVNQVLVDVGDTVEKRQKISVLELGELLADLRQAKAGVELAYAELSQTYAAVNTQQALLDELNKGARPEELTVAQGELSSAVKSLSEAKINVNVAKLKATEDLNANLTSAATKLLSAVNDAKLALMALSDIQFTYFANLDNEKFVIEKAKEDSINQLFDIQGAGSWNSRYVSELNGGLFGEIQNLSDYKETVVMDYLDRSIKALRSVKTALQLVPSKSEITVADKALLQSQITVISNQINTISASKSSIESQKAANSSAVALQNTALISAQNLVKQEQEQLALVKAGATPEAIRAQKANVQQQKALLSARRASVKSAKGRVDAVRAQINKREISSPIMGIITRSDAKEGEIVQANTSLFTVITQADLEIEANVPEVAIAKINLGNSAEVTLDAYGDEKIFSAQVTDIDPASITIDGLPTYKVTLQFKDTNLYIKPGMTANIRLITSNLEGVIIIPVKAVLTKDRQKYVRILPKGTIESDNIILEERNVILGKTGSDGMVEVKEGLTAGERVITSIE